MYVGSNSGEMYALDTTTGKHSLELCERGFCHRRPSIVDGASIGIWLQRNQWNRKQQSFLPLISLARKTEAGTPAITIRSSGGRCSRYVMIEPLN